MTDVSLSKLIANVLDNTQLEGGAGRRRAYGGAAPADGIAPVAGPAGGAFDGVNGLVDSTFGSFNTVAGPTGGMRSTCGLRGGEGPTPAAQASAAAALTFVAAGDSGVTGGEANMEGGKRKLPEALKRFHAMARARVPSLRKKHPSWNKFELWREANKLAGREWKSMYGSKGRSKTRKTSRRRSGRKMRSGGRR